VTRADALSRARDALKAADVRLHPRLLEHIAGFVATAIESAYAHAVATAVQRVEKIGLADPQPVLRAIQQD
jgi:hypothetical protein